jgi:cytochrome c oxidase subunit I+III
VYVFAVGLLLTLFNLFWSRRHWVAAGPNPWGAATLEWLAESPPEHFNFAHIPVVHSREPLWDGGVTPGPAYDEARLTPRTSTLDATLEEPIEMPEDNAWTLVSSIALLVVFAGLLYRSYPWVIAGVAVTLFSAARWMWPTTTKLLETEA